MSMTWTEERVEKLKTLWMQGYSGSKIAEMLDIPSRNAVMGKIHRLKLPKRVRRSLCKSRIPGRARVTVATDSHGRAAHKSVRRQKTNSILSSSPSLPARRLPNGSKAVLTDLETDMCRWPHGEPGTKDFHFCAHRTIPDSSYCSVHDRQSKGSSLPKISQAYLSHLAAL